MILFSVYIDDMIFFSSVYIDAWSTMYQEKKTWTYQPLDKIWPCLKNLQTLNKIKKNLHKIWEI